ncbi:MAG: EAL domain-containing protein [Spirochaetes bacterium]|nr:EAL domain-containing protein [Spirochaetota bacterium]
MVDVDVVNCSRSHRDRAVLSSLIQLARSLDLHTLAEGAEDADQLDVLTQLGCDGTVAPIPVVFRIGCFPPATRRGTYREAC